MPDAPRPVLERNVSMRGPRFFLDGKTLMFVNHLDSSTRDGPREATAADKKVHAQAFEDFKARTPAAA